VFRPQFGTQFSTWVLLSPASHQYKLQSSLWKIYAEAKNTYSNTPTPPYVCMAWCLVEQQGQFYFHLQPPLTSYLKYVPVHVRSSNPELTAPWDGS
jgi:hypothetical protein